MPNGKEPAPQQRQAEPDHIRETALDPLHQRAATSLQRKAARALQRFTGGDISLDLGGAERCELDAGGDGGEPFHLLCSCSQQTMPGVQLSPAASHPLPAGDGLSRIGRLAEHLPLKREHRITTQHRRDRSVGAGIAHRLSLGLGQQLHQLGWIGVMNRVFIDATHLHPMGDRRLLKQTPSGWRRGGKQKHGPAWMKKR